VSVFGKNISKKGEKTMIKKLSIAALLFLFVSVPSSYAEQQSPAQMVETFFGMIQKGQISQAYDQLLVNSSIPASKPQAVQLLKTQTQNALTLYGNILGIDKIHEEHFGQSIVRLVYVLKLDVVPTAWEFYFYKPKSVWFLANITFNDQFNGLESKK
jgi:hypothetical protein